MIPTEPGSGARVYLCAYERGRRALVARPRRRGDPDRRPRARPRRRRHRRDVRARGGERRRRRRRRAASPARRAAADRQPGGHRRGRGGGRRAAGRRSSRPRGSRAFRYLDELGLAAAKLEQALGEVGGSPFAEAMKTGVAASDELADEVESRYKGPARLEATRRPRPGRRDRRRRRRSPCGRGSPRRAGGSTRRRASRSRAGRTCSPPPRAAPSGTSRGTARRRDLLLARERGEAADLRGHLLLLLERKLDRRDRVREGRLAARSPTGS